MRVLVTGGAGFIGSHIVDALIASGHSVLVVDDLSTGQRENLNPAAEFFEYDVSAWDFQFRVAERFVATHICHQAAQASLLRSEVDPTRDAETNILGTLNVIHLARKSNARVVMASTSAVYACGSHWLDETSPCAPNRPYGISKWAAERYLEWSGLSYAILRYGNVYGPRQVPVGENQLVPRALDGLLRDKPFTIYGDGSHARDYVFVEDVAQANVAALQSSECGIFNIGTGHAVSVNNLVADLQALTHTEQRTIEHTDAKRGEPDFVRLSAIKAISQLHWQATVDVGKGLEKTLEWYKKTYL